MGHVEKMFCHEFACDPFPFNFAIGVCRKRSEQASVDT